MCIESACDDIIYGACFRSEWLEIMARTLVKATGFSCTELRRDGGLTLFLMLAGERPTFSRKGLVSTRRHL